MRTILLLLAFVVAAAAQEIPDLSRYPNCRGWISGRCCCTQGACREVTEDEVKQIGENLYLVIPTGERIPRTDWSKDGRFIRCAYKPGSHGQGPGGGWLIGPEYPTSCLYPIPPTS